jgi:hypothetical protein
MFESFLRNVLDDFRVAVATPKQSEAVVPS